MNIVSRFSVAQYERMIEAGVFVDDERRLELLRGEIVPMSPIGVPHAKIVNFLTRWSISVTQPEQVEVSVQNPVLMPLSESVPEPDLAWLRPTNSPRHPLPEDIYLIVEVADSTMQRDAVDKAEIYAESGVSEYWVVDIAQRVVHVYRDVIASRFASITMFRSGDLLSPLAFPNGVLEISAMFRAI